MPLYYPNIMFEDGDILVVDGEKFVCKGRESADEFRFEVDSGVATKPLHIDHLAEMVNESTQVTIIRREK